MEENQNNQNIEQSEAPIKLDYQLESPQDRIDLVNRLMDSLPPEKLTPQYLDILAKYIIQAKTKEEKKKERSIITDNHMTTVVKRETSFEGLVSKFENGEDSIYGMITNDKNILFMPKNPITQKDIDSIPALKQLCDAIIKVEEEMKRARGRRKFLLKKQLIEMRQDQYTIRSAYTRPICFVNATKGFGKLSFDDNITVTKDGKIIDKSLVSFMNPKHISALLCNYSNLKEECYSKFHNDSYYMMESLDDLVEKTLRDKYPLYYSLLIYKIDGKPNIEIQQLLEVEHGVKHSIEYISALWRNKIPKLIAEQAEIDYLNWYYTNKEYGKWKRCSRCGEIKLAHNKFFSKNNSSKDGFYSICKCCRNKKTKQTKEAIKIIKRIPFSRTKDQNDDI